jgi:ubiquinone/menaquinone biosynthesis C-methylase UbiE
MISSTFLAADGDGYEQQMGRWSRRLAEPFLDFVGVAQGERILDVGCGTGSLSFAIAARCPDSEILGIDISPVYVAHAAAHNAAFPNLRFALGDACMLTVPTGSYDSVLSLLMLHFVPKADEAVAHMRRVGRSKATVAAAV